MSVETEPGRRDVELATDLWTVIAKLGAAMRRETRSRGDDLTEAQLSIVRTLVEHGPLRISDLARCERLRVPTVTVALKRLGRLGVIGRSEDSTDLRAVLIEATPLGIQRYKQALSLRHTALIERLSALTDSERAVLTGAVNVLERLIARGE